MFEISPVVMEISFEKISVIIENGNYYFIHDNESFPRIKSSREEIISNGFLQKVLIAERKAKLEKLLK